MKAPLSPDGFAHTWHGDSLIRLPKKYASAAIPPKASDFLVRAGLPALVSCNEGDSELKMTFCRLANGLSPVLEQETVGPPLPPSWSVYWVLGDEFFCNGAAWWCIHQEEGHVARIDIEVDNPIQVANSSVAQFAFAVLAAVTWSAKCDRSAEMWREEVDRLECELRSLDARAMKSRHGFWNHFLNFIREEELMTSGFTKGSKVAGQTAWKAGPW